MQNEYYIDYSDSNNVFIQRTTGIPIPKSINQENPVFISGTGQTSDHLFVVKQKSIWE